MYLLRTTIDYISGKHIRCPIHKRTMARKAMVTDNHRIDDFFTSCIVRGLWKHPIRIHFAEKRPY